MSRLPQPGGDSGSWGNILNDFLSQAHKSDGTLKDNAVSQATITNGVVSEAKLDGPAQVKLNSVGSAPDATTGAKGIVQLAGALGGTAALPTVPALATKVAKGELVLNVKDFGAIGNGVADDTAALQATLDAANAAPSNGSREVYMPPGVYLISSTLLIDSGVSLRGQSWMYDYLGHDLNVNKLSSVIKAKAGFSGLYMIRQRNAAPSPTGDTTYHWGILEKFALAGFDRDTGPGGINPGKMGEAAAIRNVAIYEVPVGIYMTTDQVTAHLENISIFHSGIAVNIDDCTSTIRIFGLSGDNNYSILRVKGGLSLHVSVYGLKVENYTNAAFGEPVIDVVDLRGGYLGLFGAWFDTDVAHNDVIKLSRTVVDNLPRVELAGVDANGLYTNLINDTILTKTLPLHPNNLSRPHVAWNIDQIVDGQSNYNMGYGTAFKGRASDTLWYPMLQAQTDNRWAFAAGLTGGRLTGLNAQASVHDAVSWNSDATQVGFFDTTPVTKPVVSGSRTGEPASTASLRAALVALGLITDSTTP